MERIARDLGIRRETLYDWRKAGGWTRPPPPERAPCRFHRSRRFGFALCGEAISVARDLYYGSNLSARAIARQIGVAQPTVQAWRKRGGWTRQPDVAARYPSRPRHPPDAVAAARELFTTTRLPAASIGRRVGACARSVHHWARRDGWSRPPRGSAW